MCDNEIRKHMGLFKNALKKNLSRVSRNRKEFVRVLICFVISPLMYGSEFWTMLSDMVLQKNSGVTMDRRFEQRRRFREYGSKKKTHTEHQEETFLNAYNDETSIGKSDTHMTD